MLTSSNGAFYLSFAGLFFYGFFIYKASKCLDDPHIVSYILYRCNGNAYTIYPSGLLEQDMEWLALNSDRLSPECLFSISRAGILIDILSKSKVFIDSGRYRIMFSDFTSAKATSEPHMLSFYIKLPSRVVRMLSTALCVFITAFQDEEPEFEFLHVVHNYAGFDDINSIDTPLA